MSKASYKEIVNNNIEVINNIKRYIVLSNNLNSNKDIYLDTRYYIKKLLSSIRTNNMKLYYMAKQRKEITEYLKQCEIVKVSGESYDNIGTGYDNGLKRNTVYDNHIKRLQDRSDKVKELDRLLLESDLLEKSLKDNNELVRAFIEMIDGDARKLVMKMTYIECQTDTDIATTLLYPVASVDQNRWLGIKALVQILEAAKEIE